MNDYNIGHSHRTAAYTTPHCTMQSCFTRVQFFFHADAEVPACPEFPCPLSHSSLCKLHSTGLAYKSSAKWVCQYGSHVQCQIRINKRIEIKKEKEEENAQILCLALIRSRISRIRHAVDVVAPLKRRRYTALVRHTWGR